MKKQTTLAVNGRLRRGAFLLLLLPLLALCMIPFARGQRNMSNRHAATQASRFSNVNGTVPAAAKMI